MVRHNNQLPDNLPQLQNLIKRDAESYQEEFQQQYQHFLSILEIFRLSPDKENKSLEELVMFLAQVAQCYPEQLSTFPQTLVDLLKAHSTTIDSEMRSTLCRALILLRNKNLISPLDLLELFFQLLRCPDKALRAFLEQHIITDIKNMNAKQKDMKLNSTLQNFMFSMLKDSNPKAAKMSVDIMMELYKKNVWNDAKTVNAIATVGCFSKFTKVLVASLKFFLGSDGSEEGSDSEADNSEGEPDLKSALNANRVNKKTKKRKKQLDAVKKLYVKSQKKKSKAVGFNFSAVHLIHNPQGMADDLFAQLKNGNERFEVKLMYLDVISRLIGIHNLFVFSYYPYIVRFLQPHQRQVTRILQFSAQAAHELVPPEIIEPVLKTIANNFITERNSSDVMAIGLNATREICLRCPLAMGEDLLRDLALYKTYKEKSVVMAARSLISMYREQLPALLHKKDRGRPTEASIEIVPKQYGAVHAFEHIPGTEVLLQPGKSSAGVVENKRKGGAVKEDDSDSEWEDVSHSEGEANDIDDGEFVTDSEAEGEEDSEDDVEEAEDDGDEKSTDEGNTLTDPEPSTSKLSKAEALTELAATRIFTDEDFARIEAQNLKKQVTHTKSRKRQAPETFERSDLVKLDNIEMIYKKRRTDKVARIESMKRDRPGRETFGHLDKRHVHASTTNREKEKKKNFQMLRHKARGKIKKSFRDKQMALRNHLVKQKKMK